MRLTALGERLGHALLLHGPRGTGKLVLAEHFARYLLCEGREAKATGPCGRCEACHWLSAGSHPDLRVVEPDAMARVPAAAEEGDEEPSPAKAPRQPSTQIRIEQTRALGDFVHLGSHRGGRRVAILHPAEEMNVHAANSLLKSLEEPPPGAVFLLVSHRPQRLLPTIRSRCMAVPVPVPPRELAAGWLGAQGVARPERWLAFAGGSPLRALEYATGERGEAYARVLRAVASGDPEAMAEVGSRDDLEPLLEVLQKTALDQAFTAETGRPRFAHSAAASRVPGGSGAWLAYARFLGSQRALLGHPLNPRLFASELVAAMPRASR